MADVVVKRGRGSGQPTAQQMGAVPIAKAGFFAPDSFWNKLLPDDAPLHPSSAAWARNLCTQMDIDPVNGGPIPGAIPGKAWINNNEAGIAMYVASADLPLQRVSLLSEVDGHSLGGDIRGPELHATWQKGVPVPDGWTTAVGQDKALTIYQPSTDTAWEFWLLENHPEYGIVAQWGATMYRVSTNHGNYSTVRDISGVLWQAEKWGGSAANLPNFGGLVQVEEFDAGVIPHAIGMVVGNACLGPVYPARRSDGWMGPDWIAEGARVRFPMGADSSKVHPSFMPVFNAIQRYGAIIRDKTGYGCGLQFREYSQVAPQVHWNDHFLDYPDLWPGSNAQVYPNRHMWSLPWHQAQIVHPDVSL